MRLYLFPCGAKNKIRHSSAIIATVSLGNKTTTSVVYVRKTKIADLRPNGVCRVDQLASCVPPCLVLLSRTTGRLKSKLRDRSFRRV